jgi:hypothetical protein
MKEFIQGKVSRGSTECAFLHVEVSEGIVTVGVSSEADDQNFGKSLFGVAHFVKGMGYLFPSKMGEGINPVSLGRVYLPVASDVVLREGQHRIKKKWLKAPENLVTVVLWREGEEEEPISHVVLYQEELVPCIKRLVPHLDLELN